MSEFVGRETASGGHGGLSFTGRISGWSAVHRWVVLGSTVAVLLVAGLLSSILGTRITEVFGAGDSKRGQELIEERFAEIKPFAEIIIFRNPNLAVEEEAFRSTVDRLVAELRTLDGVNSVVSYYETGFPSMVSDDRSALMARLLFEPGERADLIDRVLPVIDAVVAANQQAGEDFEIEMFGDTSGNKAFDDLIEKDFGKVTLTALVGGLTIMVLAFGSVIAAIIPLVMALAAIFAAMGAAALVSQFYALQEFYIQLVLLMGLAVGVDYSLFVVNRFREERAAGRPKLDAIRVAGDTTGRAVFYAGITVVVSLSGLMLTQDALFIGLGIGAIIVVLFSIVASMTLLPAVLAVMGDWVNRLRVPGLYIDWGRANCAVSTGLLTPHRTGPI